MKEIIKITSHADSGKTCIGTPGSREGWPTRTYRNTDRADRWTNELAERMPEAEIVYVEGNASS